jgi:hypothetical protein
MVRTGYEIFVNKLSELEEGKELQKEIRDTKTYKRKNVKAIFSSSPEKLPDGEPLWVRGNLGPLLDKKPWRIKIVSES